MGRKTKKIRNQANEKESSRIHKSHHSWPFILLRIDAELMGTTPNKRAASPPSYDENPTDGVLIMPYQFMSGYYKTLEMQPGGHYIFL